MPERSVGGLKGAKENAGEGGSEGGAEGGAVGTMGRGRIGRRRGSTTSGTDGRDWRVTGAGSGASGEF